MKAALEIRLARVEAANRPPPSHERGRGFIVDGDTVIDRATGKEPDPETLRKIRAGDPTGPFDFVRVIVDSPGRARLPSQDSARGASRPPPRCLSAAGFNANPRAS
jgi:hypothetical protein